MHGIKQVKKYFLMAYINLSLKINHPRVSNDDNIPHRYENYIESFDNLDVF